MRVTKKLLTKLVNEKLKEVEMDFEVERIERSRFREQDYEDGAYFWKAILDRKNSTEKFIIKPFIYSFIPFMEFEDALNSGKKLTIINNSRHRGLAFDDLEISYK